ncbi:hypothetical protein [Pleomorphovibrio marinus]|uniref:hypothetical protein n=1 Tax=Pleomorphovibrio marinus TaxID=2164132 RepID=UPI000E0B7A30|nr:hypothetical protein [Pleomorphovibrio marinus]
MKISLLLVLALFLFITQADLYAGVEIVDYRGWRGCYRLFNQNTEVIINPHTGARVMVFAHKGQNIIHENPDQDGTNFEEWKESPFDPDGGRLDYGPEMETRRIHALTWMGPWEVEVTGAFSLRMNSTSDQKLGLVSQRIFSLDPGTGKLTITQIGENISADTLVRHFWGRTLVKPGGIMMLPLATENSRFEQGVGKFAWNPNRIEENPEEDERLWIKGGILHFHAIGSTYKAGTDAKAGWMSYQLGQLRMVKRFPVFAEASYEGSEHMTGIFYSNGRFAEMEPCGPTRKLAPGESFSFTEEWELEVLAN